jgi:tetratricopeptide (TPR) repeat protein
VLEQGRDRIEEAKTLYRRAQVLGMEAGETRLTALIAQNLGTLADIAGDSAMAIAAFTSAVQQFRSLNDVLGGIRALNNLGVSYTNPGRWLDAEAALDEALAV